MTLANTSRLSRNLLFRHGSFDPTHVALSLRCEKLIDDLKSCRNVVEVSQIHGYMVKAGLDQDSFAISKLLAFSIQDIRYASSIFGHVSDPNLYMFNTMLRGYSISDEPEQAFRLFNRLREKGFTLDQFSFIPTLKSCARESAIAMGQGIHGVVLRSGFMSFTDLKNALLHFYGICGRSNDARKLFDEMPHKNDVVSYNTLMNGYLQVSKPELVLDLVRNMRESEVAVNVGTLLSVLSATGDVGDLSGGESVYGLCIKTGLDSGLNLITALIGMYAKTGNIGLARRIFDSAVEKDVVAWNCMIDKYAKMGLLEECLCLLRQMKHEQVKPNSSTCAGLLSCCAVYEAPYMARIVGDFVEEEGLALDAVLGTALIDTYAKIGFLDRAVDIFDRMENKDVKTWTAMISGYGAHGLAREAITLFHKMEEICRVKPNKITFLVVLNACSHGGLVKEGIECFKRMVDEYGIIPSVEHYGCMVDLLGRGGILGEAYDLIRGLPIRTDSIAWRSLLAACRVYGNLVVGERVKMALVEMGERHPTDDLLLSGAHAVAGNFQEQQKPLSYEVYTEKKEAGYSNVEME
ncbi:PREDICTED: pentatricopeptide repeat-containing protein At1g26900, mitochondrial isoform X2 [Tarenaya hassleriana]|uniref:pentatricopeptide repeat-containing protein At1g26900, mitochondrial isoform X1 n=1 Tax=Tarenaya hassleriana TaxID=28532 RepID=UPI00053C7023|nr:PREDICTED: pentatricopeptide repeat-containing protein At1g26900, mitochondrial isoform X1 [Tarenaya hassleriana]XP_010551530.1 PREDICTED: pentatricopeptide repeat-containing protein At1g26900, mitochondrial isoform X2 [Tarenaya hassleriana]